MADVLSTVWGLVKQTIGGNRNTWGGILNANMDILEAALSGVMSKAVTGGSVTLTNTERRNRILSLSGTLSSDSTIIIANLPAVWLAKNGTSGAFSLSFKTAAGAAVALDQGGWSVVWCDGNDNIYVGPASTMFSAQFKLPDGTLAAPALAFLNETGLGVRRAGYATGTLGSNPFTTANGLATVTVHHVAHGMAANDDAFYSGATAVNGITIDGLYNVTSITDPDNYVITHTANANASGAGGGTPAYKYMKAAASGGAIAVSKGGADIAHISPYGVLWTGDLAVSGTARLGALLVSGATTLVGALAAAAATFSGAITGTTATLTGLLTLSSTSHVSMPGGTTAQRPASPASRDFRINEDLGRLEYYWNGAWRAVEVDKTQRGHIDGLIVSNGTTHATTAIDVSAGSCRSSDDTQTIALAAALTDKQLDSSWAAGSGAGMRSSASLADGTWHIFAIAKADGTSDIFAHNALDPTSVLPNGYTKFRIIFSIIRVTSAIKPFKQIEDWCLWVTPPTDVNNGSPGTSRNTVAITVPTGMRVQVILGVTGASNGGATYITSGDTTDTAPSFSNGLGVGFNQVGSGNWQAKAFTDTSAQIAYRASTNQLVVIVTQAFRHPRGRNA